MDHRTAGPMPNRVVTPPLPPLYAREEAGRPPTTREAGADEAMRSRIEMLLREWRS